MASGENSTQEKLGNLPAKINIDKNLAKKLGINSEEDICSIRGNLEWRCFGCCKVTTGAMAIGIWRLVTDTMMFLVLLSVFVFNEHTLSVRDVSSNSLSRSNSQLYALNCTSEPCSMASMDLADMPRTSARLPDPTNSDMPDARISSMRTPGNCEPLFLSGYSYFFFQPFSGHSGLMLAIVLALAFLTMDILLVRGVIRRRPNLALPFLFLQVSDYCVLCMAVMSRLGSRQHKLFPFDQNAVFCVYAALVLLIKGYCVYVVWLCWRYLLAVSEDGLPSYKAVCVKKEQSAPPPSYDEVMTAHYNQV